MRQGNNARLLVVDPKLYASLLVWNHLITVPIVLLVNETLAGQVLGYSSGHGDT